VVDQVIARLDETDLKLAENAARAVGSARSRRDVARTISIVLRFFARRSSPRRL
jgi:hypothetical protein